MPSAARRRQDAARLRMATHRDNMPENVASQVRESNAEAHRQQRAQETEQATEARQQEDATRHSRRRAAETIEDHSGHLERRRIHDRLATQAAVDMSLKGSLSTYMASLTSPVCGICKESFYGLKLKHDGNCGHCQSPVTGTNIFKYSDGNNMDPGEQPEELKSLTFIEKRLIAKISAFVSFVHLKGGGQLAYKQNCVHRPQAVEEIVTSLPRDPSTLTSVVVINKQDGVETARDFDVDGMRIYNALLWLKAHHPSYANIEINRTRCENMPRNVFSLLPSVTLDNPDQEPFTGEDNEYFESGVTSATHATHQQLVEGATSVRWPTVSENLVNEFTTGGYWMDAYPHLFCHGKAGFRVPRHTAIKQIDWIHHMMLFHDGRFAKDETFRYDALNTYQRHQALNQGSVFVSRLRGFESTTLAELREELTRRPELYKSILHCASSIKGTNPFWYKHGGELKDMVAELGMPTAFVTLSFSDMHCPELFDQLAPNVDFTTMSSADEFKLKRKLIRDNPQKATFFFFDRVKYFLDNVMYPKFKIKAHWGRFECQHRGSEHFHMMFWPSDAPDPTKFDSMTPEELQAACDYYAELSCALNHNCNINAERPRVRHPCSLRRNEVNVEEEPEFLASIVQEVNRHTRCTPRCLRRVNGQDICRYGFPYELQDIPKLAKDEKGRWTFYPARNDALVNCHNDFVCVEWQGNHDFQIITSLEKLVSYLCKYIAKCEKFSDVLKAFLVLTAVRGQDSDPVVKAAQKLLLSTVGSRDYPAPEVVHLLSTRPMVLSSHQFVSLNFSAFDRQDVAIVTEGEVNTVGGNIIVKYARRRNEMGLTLREMAKNWTFHKNNIWSRRGDRCLEKIIRVFPKLNLSDDPSNNELFYRQQVLLNVPWSGDDPNTFFAAFSSWQEIYEFYEVGNIGHLEFPEPDDEGEEIAEQEVDHRMHEDEIVSVIGGNTVLPTNDDLRGHRERDLNSDWQAGREQFQDLSKVPEYLTGLKNDDIGTDDLSLPLGSFSPEQQSVLDLVSSHLNGSTSFKCITVQGPAGTGKSYTINGIKRLIHQHSPETRRFLVLAPTGAAASNISGATLHAAIRIPTGEIKDLTGDSLSTFQHEMRDIQYIIIDEMSMVSLEMWFKLDKRLKESKASNELFGGVHLYVFGDLLQLPPVRSTPIYAPTTHLSQAAAQGFAVFRGAFRKHFELKILHRQAGDTSLQLFLTAVANGTVTMEQYNTCMTRLKDTVSNQERASFDNALRIFSTKAEVNSYNLERLDSLRSPVAIIDAIHTPSTGPNLNRARAGTSDQTMGLDSTMAIAVGCPVMLRRNICTRLGLVNGAVGIVRHIVYAVNKSPPTDMPEYVMIDFGNQFKGRTFEDSGCVPITPLTAQWTWKDGTTRLTRKQFPFKLAYAITTHAAQGKTLDKAVVDPGTKEFAAGLAYVAFSRVKSWNGLLLEKVFPFTRLDGIKSNAQIHLRKQEMLRLSTLK